MIKEIMNTQIFADEDYVRVTELIGKFKSLSHIPEDILAKAGERGTAVHKECVKIITNHEESEDFNPEWEGYINSFKQWVPNKKVLFHEYRIYDNELLVTGEFDLVLEDGILVDIKTSAKADPVYWPIQLGGYEYLCGLIGIEINKRQILHLSKEGKPPKLFEYHSQVELFLKILEVYNYFYRR